MKSCSCGCGEPVTRAEYKYRRGHKPRSCECGASLAGRSHHKKKCDACLIKLCKCGCGAEVSSFYGEYAPGHHQRGKTKRKTLKQTCVDCAAEFMTANGTRPRSQCSDCLNTEHHCECGCGSVVVSAARTGARFVRGHQRKGQTYSDEYRAAIRKSMNQPHVITKMSHAHRNQNIKQTLPEKLLHDALDGRSWKFVGSSRLHDGSPNPSGVAADLPISADIVCRSKRVILMVDGCYWHECPLHGQGKFTHVRERDQRKSLLAEQAGWAVHRVWEHEVKTNLSNVVRRLGAERFPI